MTPLPSRPGGFHPYAFAPAALRVPQIKEARAPHRNWQDAGKHAGTCCGRLCKCVPSPTLKAGSHHVDKGSSMVTDNTPVAIHIPRHTSKTGGTVHHWGLLSGCRWSKTWPASVYVPEQPFCEIPSRPFLPMVRFVPRRPCLVVNPGNARALWQQPSGKNNFPCADAHSSRDKFFLPTDSPLRFDRKRCCQPVPRRTDHNKDAMGANLSNQMEKHHG